MSNVNKDAIMDDIIYFNTMQKEVINFSKIGRRSTVTNLINQMVQRKNEGVRRIDTMKHPNCLAIRNKYLEVVNPIIDKTIVQTERNLKKQTRKLLIVAFGVVVVITTLLITLFNMRGV